MYQYQGKHSFIKKNKIFCTGPRKSLNRHCVYMYIVLYIFKYEMRIFKFYKWRTVKLVTFSYIITIHFIINYTLIFKFRMIFRICSQILLLLNVWNNHSFSYITLVSKNYSILKSNIKQIESFINSISVVYFCFRVSSK